MARPQPQHSWFQGVVTMVRLLSTPKQIIDKLFNYYYASEQNSSKILGVILRVLQFGILCYVIGYVLIYKKGYQALDIVQSTTTTKLKGALYTNYSQLAGDQLNQRVFDVADYVVPPQDNNAFFVTTSLNFVVAQKQDVCQENPKKKNVNCSTDADCPMGQHVVNGNGVRTGQCNLAAGVCMIYAWCPVEEDNPKLKTQALLAESERFTVLIKNHIEFTEFNFKKRNILQHEDRDYLEHCHYNQSDFVDRLCPIFELVAMVKNAGQDYDDIAIEGGVIKISITWNCDLDWDYDNCVPHYSFRRLGQRNASIAPGYNFRYANYYQDARGVMRRDLFKATGIRFLLDVSGRAGKLHVVPLLLNLGSGLVLLAIASTVCRLLIALRKIQASRPHPEPQGIEMTRA